MINLESKTPCYTRNAVLLARLHNGQKGGSKKGITKRLKENEKNHKLFNLF
jgi:hypothetical protein